MTLAKKTLCVFFVSALLATSMLPLEATADGNVPVFRVAWITHLDETGRLSDNGNKDNFKASAYLFEEFIETHTNNAVDIQIYHFEVWSSSGFYNATGQWVQGNLAIPLEIIERYDLDGFDVHIRGVNLNHGLFGGSATENRTTVVNFAFSNLSEEWLMAVAIHEFLHAIGEFWFRNELRFRLPQDVSAYNPSDPSALHNPSYFGFGGRPRLDWYAVWFSQTIPNPRYPFQEPRYLGIPPEAWHHTPSRAVITLNPNNGNDSTVYEIGSRISSGRPTFQRPPNPEPTAETGDYTFMGWFRDPEFTLRAWFPHRVTGNVSFYALWGEIGGLTVPSDNAEAFICLDAERLTVPPGFNRAAHSINGGRTWRVGARHGITHDRFRTMLNRDLHLVLTDNWDSSARRPADGATVITFPPIQRRPRTNTQRLRPFHHDETWSLMTRVTRNTPTPFHPDGTYDFVRSTTTRLPASPEWYHLGGSFDTVSRPPRNDRTRNVFFFRSSPVVNQSDEIFIPASRPFRVSPAPFRNAPNLRINYNTEVLRMRRGQEYSIDGGATWTPTPLEANRPVPLDVSHHITSGTAIMIRTATTGRRPSSEIRTITPQARAPLAENLPLELNILSNGRIDPDALRPYRAWINNSWRAVPRINANNAGTHQIRLHPTARISGGAWSGSAASETGTLHTAWGEIGRDSRDRPIMGVTRAVITAYGETLPPAPTSAPPLYAEIPDATTPPAVQMNSTTDPALQMDVVTEADLPVDVDVTTEAAVQIE